MAKNTVKIIDNYIEVRFIGDQSQEAVEEVGAQVQTAAQQFVDKDEWVRVMVDLTDMGKTTSGSRRASREAYNYGTYDKLVVFGAGKFMKSFVNAVIRTSAAAINAP